MASKKPTVRFSLKMSIDLLHEVIRQNPYKEVDAKAIWIEIAISVTEMWNDPQKKLSDRTAKQHTKTCLKNYKAWKAASKKKSGISEKKTKRNDLCQEILDLQDEGKLIIERELQEREKKQKAAQEKKLKEGKKIREAAMANMKADASESEEEPNAEDRDSDEEEESKPPKPKKKRITKMQVNMNVLELLEMKMKGMIDNEAKKLANEERMIALRERAMALQESKSKDDAQKSAPKPSTSSAQNAAIETSGAGGEPRYITQLQPAAFNFGLDSYPFKF